MKQVKEELEKGKAVEARRTKEVAQLRKEQVRKEGLIRNLEKEKRQKEAVLKRKQEEVNLLIFFAADFAEFVGTCIWRFIFVLSSFFMGMWTNYKGNELQWNRNVTPVTHCFPLIFCC